ncbi:hypothetical protein ACSDR0_28110 [Streptosporangium sp. G11]|uniref:hypothetical protein n=1 Tax=Streptosporangium sp. G11 TaxID=3436926 RepID=UPI003EBC6B76
MSTPEPVEPPRPARHRKDEEWDEEWDEEADAVTCSPVRRSWTYLDSRPFSMPPPPSPWRRPWSRLSRDHFLRPALIAGFLAAAGVGVWSSGWSPWDGVPTADTSPAPPGERLLAGRDRVITPSRAPVPAGVGARAPAGKEQGGGERKVPRRAPGRALPAERALSGAGDTRDEWIERVERAKPVKKPVKPDKTAERAGRHREGGGSARAGAGSGGTGSTAPVAGAGRKNRGGVPETGGRASEGAGRESGRGDGGAGRETRNARGGGANTGGDAGSAGTAGRSRPGAREGRTESRASRTGAPATRTPSPSASRSRPPSAGGGSAAGISAAYACRHLPSGDWRHAYCVRVWNDYKNRNGLP